MTVQTAMFLLTISAVVTSLITEAIKKAFNVKAANIVALIVSVLVGAGVPAGYLIINKLTFTSQDIVYMIAMVVLTWLCATLGYDKVVQAIAQIINKGLVNKGEDKE